MIGKTGKNMEISYMSGALALVLLLIAALSSLGAISATNGTSTEIREEYGIDLECQENNKVTATREEVKYEITMKNLGNVPDTYELSLDNQPYPEGIDCWLQFPDGSSYSGGDDKPVMEFEPNETMPISLFVVIYYSDGGWEINVTGRSLTSGKTDAVSTYTTVGQPRYGIDLNCMENEKTTAPEVTVEYNISVLNTGTEIDDYGIDIVGEPYMADGIGCWFQFPDGSIYPNGEGVVTWQLEPDEMVTILLYVHIYYTNHTFEISVTARSLTSGDADTISTYTTVGEPSYGIVLDCQENSRTTTSEQTVEYDISVKNLGDVADEVALSIGGPAYMLDGVGSWLVLPDGSVYTGGGEGAAFRLGARETVTVTLGVNVWYQEGTWEINFTAQSRDSGETHTIRTFTTVNDTGGSEYVDLRPEWIMVKCNCTPRVGSTIPLLTRIKNTGDVIADCIIIAFFDGNASLGNASIDTVGPGGIADVFVDWTPMRAGDHAIIVMVDPGNRIVESDERNNNMDALIKVDNGSNEPGGNTNPPNNEPGNEGNVSIRLDTDKDIYLPREHVEISITAINPDPEEVELVLHGNSTYTICIYDSNGTIMFAGNYWDVFGPVIIPPNGGEVIGPGIIWNHTVGTGEYRIKAAVFTEKKNLECEKWITIQPSSEIGTNASKGTGGGNWVTGPAGEDGENGSSASAGSGRNLESGKEGEMGTILLMVFGLMGLFLVMTALVLIIRKARI